MRQLAFDVVETIREFGFAPTATASEFCDDMTVAQRDEPDHRAEPAGYETLALTRS